MGRQPKSQIRQNIVEILHFLGEGTGYEIYKIYKEVFPHCTQRSIYYHLKKGVELKEFRISKIEREKGDFSWGPEAEKIYYVLGENAKPKVEPRVKEFLENRAIQKQPS